MRKQCTSGFRSNGMMVDKRRKKKFDIYIIFVNSFIRSFVRLCFVLLLLLMLCADRLMSLVLIFDRFSHHYRRVTWTRAVLYPHRSVASSHRPHSFPLILLMMNWNVYVTYILSFIPIVAKCIDYRYNVIINCFSFPYKIPTSLCFSLSVCLFPVGLPRLGHVCRVYVCVW